MHPSVCLISGTVVKTDCVSTAGVSQSDPCAQYRTQYTVQDYTNYCCYSTSSGGAPYYVTNCFCTADYCQENIPETVGSPTLTPSPPPPAGSTMSLMNPTCWALPIFTITAM